MYYKQKKQQQYSTQSNQQLQNSNAVRIYNRMESIGDSYRQRQFKPYLRMKDSQQYDNEVFAQNSLARSQKLQKISQQIKVKLSKRDEYQYQQEVKHIMLKNNNQNKQQTILGNSFRDKIKTQLSPTSIENSSVSSFSPIRQRKFNTLNAKAHVTKEDAVILQETNSYKNFIFPSSDIPRPALDYQFSIIKARKKRVPQHIVHAITESSPYRNINSSMHQNARASKCKFLGDQAIIQKVEKRKGLPILNKNAYSYSDYAIKSKKKKLSQGQIYILKNYLQVHKQSIQINRLKKKRKSQRIKQFFSIPKGQVNLQEGLVLPYKQIQYRKKRNYTEKSQACNQQNINQTLNKHIKKHKKLYQKRPKDIIMQRDQNKTDLLQTNQDFNKVTAIFNSAQDLFESQIQRPIKKLQSNRSVPRRQFKDQLLIQKYNQTTYINKRKPKQIIATIKQVQDDKRQFNHFKMPDHNVKENGRQKSPLKKQERKHIKRQYHRVFEARIPNKRQIQELNTDAKLQAEIESKKGKKMSHKDEQMSDDDVQNIRKQSIKQNKRQQKQQGLKKQQRQKIQQKQQVQTLQHKKNSKRSAEPKNQKHYKPKQDKKITQIQLKKQIKPNSNHSINSHQEKAKNQKPYNNAAKKQKNQKHQSSATNNQKKNFQRNIQIQAIDKQKQGTQENLQLEFMKNNKNLKGNREKLKLDAQQKSSLIMDGTKDTSKKNELPKKQIHKNQAIKQSIPPEKQTRGIKYLKENILSQPQSGIKTSKFLQTINPLKLQTFFWKINLSRQCSFKQLLQPEKTSILNIKISGQKQQQMPVKQIIPHVVQLPTKDQLKNLLDSYQPLKFQYKQIFNQSEYFTVQFIPNQSLYFGSIVKSQHGQIRQGNGVLIRNNSWIQAQFKNNQPIQGVEITQAGKYEGSFQNDRRQGTGQFFWRNGQYYSGQWKKGFKHGKGLWKSKPNQSNRSDSYDGEWKNGKVQGHGIHTTIFNQVYEGQFKCFLKTGKGVQKFPNGDSYEGDYDKGLPSGTGTYKWKSGFYYTGKWSEGLRHQQGIIVSPNDKILYKGTFLRDKVSGYGQLNDSEGNTYLGTFLDGMKHGKGRLTITKSKKIIEGQWRLDQYVQC